MFPRFRIPLIVSLFFMSAFLFVPQANAAKPIGEITGLEGRAFIISENRVIKTPKIGQPVYENDQIQTDEGKVEITFNDGAKLNINQFTSTMIHEFERKTSWWVFKAKNIVRRISCFVGSSCFRSGKSKKQNAVQTPTAVCGVRGSHICYAHDLTKNYFNVIEGAISILGPAVRGDFTLPGKEFAKESDVYGTNLKAYETGKPEDIVAATEKAHMTLLRNEPLKGDIEYRKKLVKMINTRRGEFGIEAYDDEIVGTVIVVTFPKFPTTTTTTISP